MAHHPCVWSVTFRNQDKSYFFSCGCTTPVRVKFTCVKIIPCRNWFTYLGLKCNVIYPKVKRVVLKSGPCDARFGHRFLKLEYLCPPFENVFIASVLAILLPNRTYIWHFCYKSGLGSCHVTPSYEIVFWIPPQCFIVGKQGLTKTIAGTGASIEANMHARTIVWIRISGTKKETCNTTYYFCSEYAFVFWTIVTLYNL